MLRQIRTISLLPAVLIALLAVMANGQSASKVAAGASSPPPVTIEPWLVTVVHQINIQDLQSSLAQRGIKVKPLGLNNLQPININTGIVIDRAGHILTRLVNINPESGISGVGSITVLLPSGEQRPAKFIGMDGPSGFCLISVENLNVEPANLASQA